MSEKLTDYKQYRRKQIAELADWVPGFDMTDVSISEADKKAGSPKLGDKIARNPANHDDRWLIAADYFAANFEPLQALRPADYAAGIEDAAKVSEECYPQDAAYDAPYKIAARSIATTIRALSRPSEQAGVKAHSCCYPSCGCAEPWDCRLPGALGTSEAHVLRAPPETEAQVKAALEQAEQRERGEQNAASANKLGSSESLQSEAEAAPPSEQEPLQQSELYRMQMAAISTAALQNTRASEPPLPKGHPYWTPAYQDVIDAVGREIEWREKYEKATSEQEAVAWQGWHPITGKVVFDQDRPTAERQHEYKMRPLVYGDVCPARREDGMVLVPESTLRWLLGEEGKFECPPSRYFRGKPTPYWWRHEVRAMLAAGRQS